MRKAMALVAVFGMAAALAGCASTRSTGFGNRRAPNEFAVTRNPPLIVPPDYTLRPPRPGTPRAASQTDQQDVVQAMFGGLAQASSGQNALVDTAGGAPAPGVRSEAGDPGTTVVDKGKATPDIVAAPASNAADASVSTPQSQSQ